MKEIEYEVTRNISVDGDKLDRYAVYRLLLLSFENDVRSVYMEFDELLTVEKVVADIIRPFIRLSSLDLKLSVNGEMWRKPPAPNKSSCGPYPYSGKGRWRRGKKSNNRSISRDKQCDIILFFSL